MLLQFRSVTRIPCCDLSTICVSGKLVPGGVVQVGVTSRGIKSKLGDP